MTTLSIVVPVFNEQEAELRATLAALDAGLADSDWDDPELVLVDDGSDTPLAEPALAGARVRVLRQANRGRFEARRAGIDAASGEYILLLDSRVTLDPVGLGWVAGRVRDGEAVWNGHCRMANPDSSYARFWNVLTHAAFSDYLENPRTTSFGVEEYDRFPKGTGHFLAPRQWLLEAISSFDSRYRDSRFSSDDTHLLRAIAGRSRIHISPQFASRYRNREALRPFLTHAIHRGTTFYDGFARRGTRFLPAIAVALPGSLIGLALVVRRPRIALGAALGVSGGSTAFALRRRRPSSEALAFGMLICPFATAFSAGIWRGVWLSVRARSRP